MKIRLAALLTALLLLLAACAAPAPESEITPPDPESVSRPESESTPPPPGSVPELEPEAKDVSHYYVEGDQEGAEDEEAVKALYWYLWNNLRPSEYTWIRIDGSFYDPEKVQQYWVTLTAPDKAPVDALLQNYDGLWAAIHFEQNDITLYDQERADDDLRVFLDEHPEIRLDGEIGNAVGKLVLYVEEMNDDLTAFIENYPVKGVYQIIKSGTPNPD